MNERMRVFYKLESVAQMAGVGIMIRGAGVPEINFITQFPEDQLFPRAGVCPRAQPAG